MANRNSVLPSGACPSQPARDAAIAATRAAAPRTSFAPLRKRGSHLKACGPPGEGVAEAAHDAAGLPSAP